MKKKLETFMVKSPYKGNPEMSLKEALDIMVECEIRHLPIVQDEKLVGVISERDLRAYTLLPMVEKLSLENVMKRDVFVAQKSSPLSEVVRTMQERKLGSTVVTNGENEVVGIFTVTDALDLLADLLDEDSSEEYVLDDCYEPWNFGESLNSPY